MAIKLTLNDQANLFILAEYHQPKKRTLDTPFGSASIVYNNKVLIPYKQSEHGSNSYRASLSRAFNRAKQQIYFNPDMTKFITLTYRDNMQDMDKLLSDVKYLIKQQTRHDQRYSTPPLQNKPTHIQTVLKQRNSEIDRKKTRPGEIAYAWHEPRDRSESVGTANAPLSQLHELTATDERPLTVNATEQRQYKYLFIVEQQKRGALHVHMIANDFLTEFTNENGFQSVKFWDHGFSSVKDVKNTDGNFKPFLYLFKYMKKSQRIGKSFIHSSRNLNNFMELTDFEFDKLAHDLQFRERSKMGELNKIMQKSYYKKNV